jgi:hypothetical protein
MAAGSDKIYLSDKIVSLHGEHNVMTVFQKKRLFFVTPIYSEVV